MALEAERKVEALETVACPVAGPVAWAVVAVPLVASLEEVLASCAVPVPNWVMDRWLEV